VHIYSVSRSSSLKRLLRLPHPTALDSTNTHLNPVLPPGKEERSNLYNRNIFRTPAQKIDALYIVIVSSHQVTGIISQPPAVPSSRRLFRESPGTQGRSRKPAIVKRGK
jgi:hypothetical protein